MRARCHHCVALPHTARTDGLAATARPNRRCALTWPSTHDSALRNCSETRIIELSTTSLPTSKHSLHLQHRRIIACNRQLKTHVQDAPYNVDRLCTHRTALLLSADRSMTPCDRTRRSDGGAEAKCAEAQLSVGGAARTASHVCTSAAGTAELTRSGCPKCPSKR